MNTTEIPRSFDDLGEAMVREVLKRVPDWSPPPFTWDSQKLHGRELGALSLVCKQWKGVADEFVAVLRVPKVVESEEELVGVLQRFPNVTSVIVDCELELSLGPLSDFCPKLERLHINRDTQPAGQAPPLEQAGSTLGANFSLLRELSVKFTCHPSVRSNCHPPEDTATIPCSLSRACPNLQELTLAGLNCNLTSSVGDLIFKSSTKLTTLSLRACGYASSALYRDLCQDREPLRSIRRLRVWDPAGRIDVPVNELPSVFPEVAELDVWLSYMEIGSIRADDSGTGVMSMLEKLVIHTYHPEEVMSLQNGRAKTLWLLMWSRGMTSSSDLSLDQCHSMWLGLVNLKLENIVITNEDFLELASDNRYPRLKVLSLDCCTFALENMVAFVERVQHVDTVIVEDAAHRSWYGKRLYKACCSAWLRNGNPKVLEFWPRSAYQPSWDQGLTLAEQSCVRVLTEEEVRTYDKEFDVAR
eukprot:TRINITY_DN2873_c0_g1_i1.p1 TRINITY_DN2873_c0_g1~~TRINITY_DN2873_c0_g1_i1.p1  ORF type:complete len:472 (+),score=32.63 TRINITY_DN2873_c0_g1_i1:118-1533(+)